MPHPEIVNTTPFPCALTFVHDEVLRTWGVVLVQATLDLGPDGSLRGRPQQAPIDLAGAWWGAPGLSSMKREPQLAFTKPGTDIILQGHAYPTQAGGSEGMVGLRVGPCQQVARVFGPRRMTRRLGGYAVSPPQPFERIPLLHEMAFGGWDRRHPDAAHHSFESRNPVGMGYLDPRVDGAVDVAMPHIEHPDHLYTDPEDPPSPVGFGWCSPDWLPRRAWGGTHDQAWHEGRRPQWPLDFDRRFFQAASPGLSTMAPLVGNESLVVAGVTPDGTRLQAVLPGWTPPSCKVVLGQGAPVVLSAVLDTVLIQADDRTVTLLWRASLPLPRGPHAVVALELPPQPAPMPDED